MRELEALFDAVEAHAAADRDAAPAEDEKLAAVQRDQDLDHAALGHFALMLGCGTDETRRYIDDHLMFAAYNPREYLQCTCRIERMSLAQCRDFHWFQMIYAGHFEERSYVAALDGKCGEEDVAGNIDRVLHAVGGPAKDIVSPNLSRRTGSRTTGLTGPPRCSGDWGGG